MLAELVRWAEDDDGIRALVLTSTRARQDGSADDLSDYDVIVAVRDAEAFVAREGWVAARGRPLVGWGDESELLGEKTIFRGVVYPDGVRLDFTIWPASLLGRVCRGRAARRSRRRLPRPPRQGRSDVDVERADVSRSHPGQADAGRVRGARRRVLVGHDVRGQGSLARRARVREVRARVRREARRAAPRPRVEDRARPRLGLRPGAYGRGLERLLPDDVVTELHATYVGAGTRRTGTRSSGRPRSSAGSRRRSQRRSATATRSKPTRRSRRSSKRCGDARRRASPGARRRGPVGRAGAAPRARRP